MSFFFSQHYRCTSESNWDQKAHQSKLPTHEIPSERNGHYLIPLHLGMFVMQQILTDALWIQEKEGGWLWGQSSLEWAASGQRLRKHREIRFQSRFLCLLRAGQGVLSSWVSYVRDQKLHASRKKKKPGSKIVIYSKKIKQGSSVSFLNYWQLQKC